MNLFKKQRSTSLTNEAFLIVLGFTAIIAAFFFLKDPVHFWQILAMHHLYLGWLVFGALFFSDKIFYLASAAVIPLFLFFHYLFFYFPNGSFRSWAWFAGSSALDMLVILGLIYLYRKQMKHRIKSLKDERLNSVNREKAALQALQKERIKAENLERSIQNQEYTFSLVYKIFRSFLTAQSDFEDALFHNLKRLTRAQSLTLFKFENGFLIPIHSKEHPSKCRIFVEGDSFLRDVCETKTVLAMPEIARSETQFAAWKASSHRGLIYVPILENGTLRYLASIDRMPFTELQARTLQALHYLKKMAELALTLFREKKSLQRNPRMRWRQVLQSPHDFLSSVENEFRRAKRFQSIFSIIAIRIQSNGRKDEMSAAVTLLNSVRSEIRALDQIYIDRPRNLIWIILPFAAFEEMSIVLNRLQKRINFYKIKDNLFCTLDYGFSVFEQDYESSKNMLKQVLEVMQIQAKVLQKMSRNHAKSTTASTT